jgi:hypothetical protein
MIGNALTAALLMGVAFACWCRLQTMTPERSKPQVQGYFLVLSTGASTSAAAHLMAIQELSWQSWTSLPFALALLVALIANRRRWLHRPPQDVETNDA